MRIEVDLKNLSYKVITNEGAKCGFCNKNLKPIGLDYLYVNYDKNMIEYERCNCEKQFKKIEVFIQSMTEEERNNPQILNSSRKRRIAEGSGISIHDINIFIKQFEQMREMMKGLNGMKKNFSKFSKMGNNLGGKLGMKQMMQNMRRFK